MATIELIIRNDQGNPLDKGSQKIYPIDLGKASFHDIEGAVEQFKRKALPDIEAELLAATQEQYVRESSFLVCNGTTPVTLKTLHGKFEFNVQRFIDKSDTESSNITYFEITGQFSERYVSDRLQECVGYYSNRLSYEEIEGLVERVTGNRQLSDQTIWEIVHEKALNVSKRIEKEVKTIIEDESLKLPKIATDVDIYEAKSREILLLQDSILVPGQKENRVRNQKVKIEDPQDSETCKVPMVSNQIILLEKKNGNFKYITGIFDERGEEVLALPEVLKSCVIHEYTKEENPLPIVAIADGAKDIRCCLTEVFGSSLTIILDWYHLGKKVREFMSMIALNKEEKNEHLKFLFHHLWRGHVYTALDYLMTKVKAKNETRLQEFIGYLEKHEKEIIDYRRRKKAGKTIGSGRVEKGCDQVIGYRQKKKGMSWSKVGSKSLGILKVMELNNHWKEVWFSQEAANDSMILPLASNMGK